MRQNPPEGASASAHAQHVGPQDAHTETKKYLVIKDHTSEHPEPVTFAKGAPLTVGERYEGPEGWDDWFFCDTPGQEGDVLLGSRPLKGWMWCRNPSTSESGWFPVANLQEVGR